MADQQGVVGMSVSSGARPLARKGMLSFAIDLMNTLWDLALIWGMVVSLILLGDSHAGRGLEVVRLLVALPVLLFFPGYLLSVALFARNGRLAFAERLGYSIVFSPALIVFVSLTLYFAGLPINRSNLVAGLVLVLGGLSMACVWRRATCQTEERFVPWRGLRFGATDAASKWSALAIVGLAVAGLGAVVYTLFAATATEHYTEFSVLRPESGKADLMLTITTTDIYSLTVTVTNQEGRPQSYELRVSGDNGYTESVPIGTLDYGLTWTRSVQVPVSGQEPLHYLKLELFLSEEIKPYRELHLWIDQTPEQSRAGPLYESVH